MWKVKLLEFHLVHGLFDPKEHCFQRGNFKIRFFGALLSLCCVCCGGTKEWLPAHQRKLPLSCVIRIRLFWDWSAFSLYFIMSKFNVGQEREMYLFCSEYISVHAKEIIFCMASLMLERVTKTNCIYSAFWWRIYYGKKSQTFNKFLVTITIEYIWSLV